MRPSIFMLLMSALMIAVALAGIKDHGWIEAVIFLSAHAICRTIEENKAP